MAVRRNRLHHRSEAEWLVPKIVFALLLVSGLVVLLLWLFQPVAGDAGSSREEIPNEEILAPGPEAAKR